VSYPDSVSDVLFITLWGSTDFLLDCVPTTVRQQWRGKKEPAMFCTSCCPLVQRRETEFFGSGGFSVTRVLRLWGPLTGCQLLSLENCALLLHHLSIVLLSLCIC